MLKPTNRQIDIENYYQSGELNELKVFVNNNINYSYAQYKLSKTVDKVNLLKMNRRLYHDTKTNLANL
jgi:hypothetical protein